MTRLDAALVARGLARSRAQARELVEAGRVQVGRRIVTKPARDVADETHVAIVGEPDPYVSRAAHKLVAALDAFPVTVADRRCIDVGASTGGFTQVLLERGARSVCALDVGHDQLAPAVAADPRVDERSGTTVRGVDPGAVGGPFDVLVTDLSFISLRLVAAELRALVTDAADLVVLVKPQFEVGRERLGKGGIVRDPSLRAEVVLEVIDTLAIAGIHTLDLARSPILGSDGNVEVLLHGSTRADAEPLAAADLVARSAAATRDPEDDPQPTQPTQHREDHR